MQYFVALKIGEKRIKLAQEFLSNFIDDNTPAMPALALKDNKDNNWQPVGEENLFAIVKKDDGFLVAICDNDGIAKTLVNWLSEEKKNELISKLQSNGNLKQFLGNVSLPV